MLRDIEKALVQILLKKHIIEESDLLALINPKRRILNASNP